MQQLIEGVTFLVKLKMNSFKILSTKLLPFKAIRDTKVTIGQ